MLTIEGNKFLLNGKEFKIYSGCIHYFRVLPQYWEDRLSKLKAAGLNTVETYIAWNMHEPHKGEYDFSGMADFVSFITIAQKLGLYVIVRPGPYICAEWDLGGYPSWLLKDRNVVLRCNNEAYMKHVEDWYRVLMEKLVPLQITHGGNIIAMQVENEYGSYGNDKTYLKRLHDLMRGCGIDVLLFTADGNWCNMISGGSLPGVYKALTFGSGAASAFSSLKGLQDENMPKTCMEFWDGWFDHWGERHHVRPAKQVAREIGDFIKNDSNFNLYMFHGGTNFGFTAGANHAGKYQPTTTSYDYNAPLNEWGDYTPLYFEIRKMLIKARGINEKDLPLPEKVAYTTVGDVALTQFASLKNNVNVIGKKHRCGYTASMEDLDENSGYMVYHTSYEGKYVPQALTLEDIHDLAYVYVNGKKRARFYRNRKSLFGSKEQSSHSLIMGATEGKTDVDIFLDCMGRVNYGSRIYDRKGIGAVRLGAQHLFDWDIYTLPMNNLELLAYDGVRQVPCFMKGTFNVSKTGECFVHTDNLTKGFVTVNGFNIGRYWKEGPQKALYLPGAILKEGENEIIIFEQEGYRTPNVRIDDKPDLG